MAEDKKVDKSEWTRSLIVKLATGFTGGETKMWLNGCKPPEHWESKAKKEFERRPPEERERRR